jgi:hypothetical protein
MKVAASFLILYVFFALYCSGAEARYFRPVYVYNAEEVGRQQRANMAERTHQQKELMEASRLNKERERISAAKTISNYPVKVNKKKARSRNMALANRQRRNVHNSLSQPQL